MSGSEVFALILIVGIIGGLIYWFNQPKSKAKIIQEEKVNSSLKEEFDSINKIIVTTGDLKAPYEIISPVFTLGQDRGGAFSQIIGGKGSPSTAFETSVLQLKNKAFKLGADAVICAKFERRVAVGQKGITGNYNQVIEFFSYGTAIKYKSKP